MACFAKQDDETPYSGDFLTSWASVAFPNRLPLSYVQSHIKPIISLPVARSSLRVGPNDRLLCPQHRQAVEKGGVRGTTSGQVSAATPQLHGCSLRPCREARRKSDHLDNAVHLSTPPCAAGYISRFCILCASCHTCEHTSMFSIPQFPSTIGPSPVPLLIRHCSG
jgi:hypothetical protein